MHLRAETDAAFHGTAANDLFKSVKGAAADKEDVARVNRHHLAARILTSAFCRHIADRAFDEFQKRLLNAFARNVARDRRIFALAGNLVDFIEIDNAALCALDVAVGRKQQLVDDVFHVFAHVTGFSQRRGVGNRKRNIERARERLSKQCLARTRGTNQQNVGLLQLNAFGRGLVLQALVVVVDRNGQHTLGTLLTDHVVVEMLIELLRRRDRSRQNIGD